MQKAVTTVFTSFPKKLTLCFVTLLCIFASTLHLKAQFYTGSQMDFGKNRVKYDNFSWTYYAYDRYDVYFYEEGKRLANYVSQEAEKQISAVEKLFDYAIDDRFEFIIYNKQSDFKQSNIGLSAGQEYNTGGVTRIAGTKIILYYEGDHAKLNEQIREGVAQIVIDQMMYGGSLRQMIKNNTLLNLPDWYLKGLNSYVASGWNSNIDNRVKDGIVNGKFKNINRLEGEDATNAGHALWMHIANNYGETVISNLLYMTKVSRSIDHSCIFVLGLSVQSLWNECINSFEKKYIEHDATKTFPIHPPVLKRPKSSRVYRQLKVSPDGKNIVYTTNELGQNKIWLYDVETEKTKRILKMGSKLDRINDFSYPLVAWHPAGKAFSFIIEYRSFLVMRTYELESGSITQRNITGFEKILDYSYRDDGKKFVMSAVKRGQTDIYIFSATSNANYQITDDIYDDLTPRFVNGSKGVVFSSNRPNDTLFFDSKRKYSEGQARKDLFLFNNENKSPVLTRITNTPLIDESHPADYDSTHISYLSDMNGVRNRFVASFDSVIAYIDTITHYRTVVESAPITNYARNILEQDVNLKANMLSEIIYQGGKYKMFVSPIVKLDTILPVSLINTSYRDYKNFVEKQKKDDKEQAAIKVEQAPPIKNVKEVIITEEAISVDSLTVDINNYTFLNEEKSSEEKKVKPVQASAIEQKSVADTIVKSEGFIIAKRRNYYTSYSVDYVVTQLDNSFLNKSYQKFSGGGGPVYLNPGLNAFLKIGMSDLFEDYRITGGVRFSNDLQSNEYFISYEDRLKHLDKQIVLHRQGLKTTLSNNTIIKIQTHDISYMLKYPFSEVASLRGSISYRNDRNIFLSTGAATLEKPTSYDHWGALGIQYVFDNTLNKGLNLYNGTRAKVFGEYYRQVDKQEMDFFVLGFDFRHYQKIHRDFIWANRIAGSSSFGNQKLIYYMGGVDNWLMPQFDNTTNIATNQNYAYQTLATNMRGFFQNARNGNNFTVINSELRLPIFKYFARQPIRSDFIENLQIVSFVDVGTAWTGVSPFSDENTLNTITIVEPPALTVTLKTQHNPIVGGYGWGLRTRLFGYFIRLDRAWGIQDGIVLKPITYISLSLDF